MWLKLGDAELVNLDHVSSIRKSSKQLAIEIHFATERQPRVLPFEKLEDRDRAFIRIRENLIKLRLALE